MFHSTYPPDAAREERPLVFVYPDRVAEFRFSLQPGRTWSDFRTEVEGPAKPEWRVGSHRLVFQKSASFAHRVERDMREYGWGFNETAWYQLQLDAHEVLLYDARVREAVWRILGDYWLLAPRLARFKGRELARRISAPRPRLVEALTREGGRVIRSGYPVSAAKPYGAFWRYPDGVQERRFYVKAGLRWQDVDRTSRDLDGQRIDGYPSERIFAEAARFAYEVEQVFFFGNDFSFGGAVSEVFHRRLFEDIRTDQFFRAAVFAHLAEFWAHGEALGRWVRWAESHGQAPWRSPRPVAV